MCFYAEKNDVFEEASTPRGKKRAPKMKQSGGRQRKRKKIDISGPQRRFLREKFWGVVFFLNWERGGPEREGENKKGQVF